MPQAGNDWNLAGRLTNPAHQSDGVDLASYHWTYDAAGRIDQLSTLLGTVHYAYHDDGQLQSATYDYDIPADEPPHETYAYDASGNRTGGGRVIGDLNRPTSDGTYSYGYDAEGNRNLRIEMMTGEYDLYTWDHRNRLTAVEHYDAAFNVLWTVAYVYDFQNRLIQRTHDADGPGSGSAVVQQFVYDGSQKLLELDENDAVTHRYLNGPAVDQILADEAVNGSTSDVLWLLADHQGTIRDIADRDETTGEVAIVEHRDYDAFGRVLQPWTTDHHFGFQGKFTDQATENTEHINRWYDAALQQWLSEDPIGLAAGDPNTRRMVSNDPVNRIDPDGLENSWFNRALRHGITTMRLSAAGVKMSMAEAKGGLNRQRLFSDEEKEIVTRSVLGERPRRAEFFSSKRYAIAEMVVNASLEKQGHEQVGWTISMIDGAASTAQQAGRTGASWTANNLTEAESQYARDDVAAFSASAALHSSIVNLGASIEREGNNFEAWFKEMESGQITTDTDLDRRESWQSVMNGSWIGLHNDLGYATTYYAENGHAVAVADGAAAAPFLEWAAMTAVDVVATIATAGEWLVQRGALSALVNYADNIVYRTVGQQTARGLSDY